FTTKPNGTGLGLATVRGIVSRLGGIVDVESRAGEGTTFTVCFPRSEEGPAGPAPEAGASPGFPAGRTVLVVDPDPATRSVVRRLLSPCGYRVLEAEEGVAALTLVEAYGGPLDLLISGLEMTDIEAEALATRVLMRHPDARALLLAGEGKAPGGWPSVGRDALPRDLAAAVEAVLGWDRDAPDGGGPSA
ncbi:MAG TPA: ATP-binding protein, partial [Longimicrobiales bacterium]|nr:ATP-binding protein [Longimicrobiales bacterium]